MNEWNLNAWKEQKKKLMNDCMNERIKFIEKKERKKESVNS